jgi:hypothetical protein
MCVYRGGVQGCDGCRPASEAVTLEPDWLPTSTKYEFRVKKTSGVIRGHRGGVQGCVGGRPTSETTLALALGLVLDKYHMRS